MLIPKKLKTLFVTTLVLSWLTTGWPPLWLSPQIPPQVKHVQAAFPTVQSRSTGRTTASNTTSHAITLPSGIQTGDLLLVTFSADGSPTVTDNSGVWTKLGQSSYSTTVTSAIFYKIATASNTLTLTTSASEQSSHVVLRISGAGIPTRTAASGSSTNSNPPNHNPGTAADYLWITTRSGDSTVVASVAPSSFTNLQSIAAAGTGGASTNTAERQFNSASLDPGTFTSASEQWVSNTISVPPPVAATTTLSTGTNPGNAAIAPGGAITAVNGFTLTTNAGTDAITAITVNLSTNSGVGTITITDAADTVLGSLGGGTGSGLVTGANSVSISSTNAGTGGTAFKVKITPLTHAGMPAPDGGSYAVTGAVTDWTGTNGKAGQATDTSDTVTIDNDSPANVTSASVTGGIEQASLSWTNPADSDFHSSVVLRRAGTAVGDTPAEGTAYSVGNPVGSSTVACVVATPTASCTDSNLTGGTAYHYKIFTKDSNGNYSAGGTVPTGSPVTPTALTISVTITSDGTISYGLTDIGTSKNTTATGLNDTQVARNDGTVAEDFNIKTSNALGGTQWTLGAAPGSNIFVHEFSLNSGGAWTPFTAANSYQSLANNISVNSSQNVDFRLTVPTLTTDYLEKTITITIQAVQH